MQSAILFRLRHRCEDKTMKTTKSNKTYAFQTLSLVLFCALGLALWSFAGETPVQAGTAKRTAAGERTQRALPQLDLQKPAKTEIALFALG